MFLCIFSLLCALCCIVSCIVAPHVYNCLFYICVLFYRPLPLGGNPIAVNKSYHILSYHIIHHIMLYIIYMSYHNFKIKKSKIKIVYIK
jgi:hypothetical protein